MGDAWVVGPFVIQQKWVLYAASIAISYVMLRGFIKKKTLDIHVLDSLWNGFFIFLFIWKISYALFHPFQVIQNPLSLLYFTGGDKGVILGMLGTMLYLYWKSKRSSLAFSYYMETALFAVLTALGSYRLLVWAFLSLSDFFLLLTALLSFAILFYLLKSKNGMISFLLAAIAEIGIFILKSRSFMAVWELAFYSILIFICLIFIVVQSRNTVKKLLPIVLLGSMVLWMGYDFIRSNSQFEHEKNQTVGLLEGNLAPDFTLSSLEGEAIRMSDFRGKRVILNFWATWCPPCRAEIPDMQKYYEDYHETDNVVIVGVNVTATESHSDIVRSFVKEMKMTFPVLLDEQRKVTSEYEVIAYPTSYFIDEQGVIRSKAVGPMNLEYMKKQVNNME